MDRPPLKVFSKYILSGKTNNKSVSSSRLIFGKINFHIWSPFSLIIYCPHASSITDKKYYSNLIFCPLVDEPFPLPWKILVYFLYFWYPKIHSNVYVSFYSLFILLVLYKTLQLEQLYVYNFKNYKIISLKYLLPLIFYAILWMSILWILTF